MANPENHMHTLRAPIPQGLAEGMFRENNQRIDFGELDRRVAMELARIARQPETTWVPNHQPKRGKDMIAAAHGGRPPFLRLLASWVWCILHIRRIHEWAVHGEEALRRISRLEDVGKVLDRISLIEGQIQVATQRLDEEVIERSQLTADLRAQVDSTGKQVSGLKREIMFQQRRLTRLTLPAGVPQVDAANMVANEKLDSLYVAFEDVFRGNRQDIKGRLTPYLERIITAGGAPSDKPVLDVGCGRGEWLELLKEKQLAAYGIDNNTMMIETAVSLGLDARQADLIAHLRGVADASLSAVTAFHVVEHLPFDVLVDFIDESLRVLVPGGVLILETPNPETMRVGATTFYYDPTHRNPLLPATLQFIVEHRGFEEVTVLKLHPFTQGLLQAKSADTELLNRVLFGPQDYAIIARRG